MKRLADANLTEKNMTLARACETLGLAVLGALACPFATAQEAPWYGGASIGRSTANVDDPRIISGLAGMGLATASITDRDRDTGYKLFGGYRFSRNIALEAGWFELGRFGYTATTVPAGTLGGDIRVNGLDLDVVGTWPLVGKLSALGRVG